MSTSAQSKPLSALILTAASNYNLRGQIVGSAGGQSCPSTGDLLSCRGPHPPEDAPMKLYNENHPAPNPRKVRIYLAEKGIDVPLQHVEIRKRQHKAPEFLAKNSLGQVPVLELDDGTHLSESLAICRYFEALHPAPPLFGTDPLDQALVEMWIMRVEFRIWRPVTIVWRQADPRTAHLGRQFTDFGEYNRGVVADEMRWLDREIGDGRAFIAGARYSMADIVALCGLDFAKFVNMPIPEECTALIAWRERVSARPSARA
jgi:glutathione S-transferase